MTGGITENHAHLDEGYYHGDQPEAAAQARAEMEAAAKPPAKPKAESKKKAG